MRWWKYNFRRWQKADRFWSEIGISQFLLDLFQFRFSMLWGTEPIPFGNVAIKIWTGSIPVSLTEMRKWNQRRNRRMRRRKPSAITNIHYRNYYSEVTLKFVLEFNFKVHPGRLEIELQDELWSGFGVCLI